MTIFEATRHSEQREEVVLGYEPTDEEWRFPNIYEDTATGSRGQRGLLNLEAASLPEDQPWFFSPQRLCTPCPSPACLAACPRQAIYKRPEDGIVLIDQE